MGAGVQGLNSWWMVSLLSVASLAAASSDLRLAEAMKNQDQEAVRSLLKEHADVNAAGADGATALAWAAHWNDVETADLLIRAGANVNAANPYGVTPLSLACTNRSAPLVEKLLEAGADPNTAQITGEAPLMTCALTGNVDTVKLLLAHRANVNAQETRRGQTALMWAVAGKHSEVARALIEHGADVRARSKSGFTALMFAAQQGDLESARSLLAAGADVNDATPEDGSALVVASASGQEAVGLLLLEKGSEPNVADGHGITALHYAARKGLSDLVGFQYNTSYLSPPLDMPELAKALLKHGANPNARIKKSLPALFTRAPYPVSMVDATPFFLAAVGADAGLMRVLAAGGADPRLGSKGNTTPLIAAAGGNRTANRSDEEKRNALEAVQVAVELGADLNATDSEGQTAMHAAAFTGADAVVQFLADHAAKVDVKDKSGQTPWSMAEGLSPVLRYKGLYGRHKSTANLLLRLGATPIGLEEMNAYSNPGRQAYSEPATQSSVTAPVKKQ